MQAWSPTSWTAFEAQQQPSYNDLARLAQVQQALSLQPGLVSFGEINQLKADLSKVAGGDAFLLQGGDCAESFDAHSEASIENTLRVLMQMAVVLTYGAKMPIVKLARIAGQYAKPRSTSIETIDNKSLPSYRGDIINGAEFSEEMRKANPDRMLKAYQLSVTTLNVMRAALQGGLANLGTLHQLNRDFAQRYSSTERFLELAQKIEDALAFMSACGISTESPHLRETRVYTSHEALLLPYEQAFLRKCPETGAWYSRSAHFLWIGDRTRQPDGAHIEMLRGVANPIGLKVGPSMQPGELVRVCHKLNPLNEPGKLTLIARFGAGHVRDHLDSLIRKVKDEGLHVIWSCDPMHGNTVTAEYGQKTRHFDCIFNEVQGFFEAHRTQNTIPGGIHLELTGEDVTECLGGAIGLDAADLASRYHTQCDPRLNFDQSLELAFALTDYLVR